MDKLVVCICGISIVKKEYSVWVRYDKTDLHLNWKPIKNIFNKK